MGGLSVRLGHRIRLEKPAEAFDAMGQEVESWTEYRKCWADVNDEGGQELLRRGQVDSVIDSTILMMYPRTGRTPQAEDRVIYNEYGTERVFEIDHVTRIDSRGRKLRLFVREDV